MADIEKLYTDHYEQIYKFLFSLCRNESIADELTQETFFRGYINIKQLRDESKAVPWLCSIAKNLYFAWFNEHKRLITDQFSPQTSSPVSVAEKVEDRMLTSDIIRHLNELEEPYKEIFMLCVFGQLPLKEISLLYGKSESWARVTFYRAKQKITEKMR